MTYEEWMDGLAKAAAKKQADQGQAAPISLEDLARRFFSLAQGVQHLVTAAEIRAKMFDMIDARLRNLEGAATPPEVDGRLRPVLDVLRKGAETGVPVVMSPGAAKLLLGAIEGKAGGR